MNRWFPRTCDHDCSALPVVNYQDKEGIYDYYACQAHYEMDIKEFGEKFVLVFVRPTVSLTKKCSNGHGVNANHYYFPKGKIQYLCHRCAIELAISSKDWVIYRSNSKGIVSANETLRRQAYNLQ